MSVALPPMLAKEQNTLLDAERLKDAELHALFVVALAHGRTKSLIKEHERLTHGDYSKTSDLLKTPEAINTAYKAFSMQHRLFELRRSHFDDRQRCPICCSAALHLHSWKVNVSDLPAGLLPREGNVCPVELEVKTAREFHTN